jgi:lipoyl-dependent peroxiredoxin
MPSRIARTQWSGGLNDGSGQVAFVSSGAGTFDVSFPRRTADSAGGVTSPEELIAAAHSSCFSMALSNELSQGGYDPQQLDVTAKVTLDEKDGAPTVTTSELTVTGTVPGIDQAAFEAAAHEAGKNCPISRALAGVDISVSATLQS